MTEYSKYIKLYNFVGADNINYTIKNNPHLYIMVLVTNKKIDKV